MQSRDGNRNLYAKISMEIPTNGDPNVGIFPSGGGDGGKGSPHSNFGGEDGDYAPHPREIYLYLEGYLIILHMLIKFIIFSIKN